MAPRPAALSPHASPRHFLGAELRCWRERRGLSLAELAGQVFLSPDMLRKVEKAQRTATPDLLHACDAVLDTGGALARLLAYAEHLTTIPDPAPHGPSAAVPAPGPVSIRLTIAAEFDGVPAPGNQPDSGGGGARIYSLAGRRRHRDES